MQITTKDERTYMACVASLGCYACRVVSGAHTPASARVPGGGRQPYLAVPLCDEHAAAARDAKAWSRWGTTETQALADTIRQLYARRFSNFGGDACEQSKK